MRIKDKVVAAVAALEGDTIDHIELAITVKEDGDVRIHYNWFECELRQKGWRFEYDDELYHRQEHE
ncbi:hypothetical protein ES703_117726 [subsurface metagenome]